jgi:hypothetical protein
MLKASVLAFAMVAVLSPAVAASLSIAWDASGDTDVAGYFVYYGTEPGIYPGVIDVGSRTTFSIPNLIEGERYYIAVKAYTGTGVAGELSTEVSGVIAPAATSGLVAAYGFEEASGATATDASPARNHGVVSGAARTASGRYGRALSFDGINDIVTVADSRSLDLAAGMTLEAWVRPSALSGWRTVLLKERPGGLAYSLYAHDNAPRPAATIFAGQDASAPGAAALPLNVWSHVAATYDGADLRLYVNGVLASTQPATGGLPSTDDPMRIGGNLIWGEYFAGRIDEVRVYNRALSGAEIAADMKTMVVTGLVAAYGFEEGAGAAAADVSGAGNNAAIEGAAHTPAGRFGHALSFDGVDDLVTVPSAAAFAGSPFTVEAWVNPTGLSGWRSAVMKEAPGGLVWGLYAHDNAPRPAVTAIIASVETSAPGTAALPLETWSHLAATYDGATLRMFVNGVRTAAVAVTGALMAASDPIRIGGNRIWGEYFSGRIDEVRIYARALSAAEIQADMNKPVDQAVGSRQ